MKVVPINRMVEKVKEIGSKYKLPPRFIFIVTGTISLIWFLFRVIPKPSRASYPCIKAVAPMAASFVLYLLSIASFTFFLRKARAFMRKARYSMATLLFAIGVLFGAISMVVNSDKVKAKSVIGTVELQGRQEGNKPVGDAKGIFPGRVVWVYDQEATNENCKNIENDYWFSNTNTNREVVNKMFSDGLQSLTGKDNDSLAWDAIFRYYNKNNDKGEVGYIEGEKIGIKINMNDEGKPATGKVSPQIVKQVLHHLVHIVGVEQTDICIGDTRDRWNPEWFEELITLYPKIIFLDRSARIEGMTKAVATNEYVLFNSDSDNGNTVASKLSQHYYDADYLLNFAVLKKHHGAGITLNSKNHFGSIGIGTGAGHMHYSMPCPQTDGNVTNGEYGVYRCFVDIMAHEHLGGKTALYFVDGLWGGVNAEGNPVKWRMPPFNNDWPNSFFLSLDPVAIESVGYDFLYEEFDENHPTEGIDVLGFDHGPFPRFPATDDYLHQAADTSQRPKDFIYDPENDGTSFGSLGTHEHWNNPIDKHYSRDLGEDTGIELLKLMTLTTIVPENSGLLSENVQSIFVDSFNVKWIASDSGVSRFDGSNWSSITKDNYLNSNKVHEMAFERSDESHELWMATDSGLSVLAYDVDGVTGATTYTTENSPIGSNQVSSVGVDSKGNRWIATLKGLQVYSGSSWDATSTLIDENNQPVQMDGIHINDMESYPLDSMMYMASDGLGVCRNVYDEVDGISGASAIATKWSDLTTNKINSITIDGEAQWYASDEGAFKHSTNDIKYDWEHYTSASGLISDKINAIEVDSSGNVWFGTDEGISVKTDSAWYAYPCGKDVSNLGFEARESEVTITWESGSGIPEGSGLISKQVNDIKQDKNGAMWVATNRGIQILSQVPTDFGPDYKAKRAVFMKAGQSGNIELSDGTTYHASPLFGEGSRLKLFWYCVYNGSGDSLTVSNLDPGTSYRLQVFEYYGEPGNESYVNTTSATNPSNFTTLDNSVSVKVVDEENKLNVYPNPFDNYLEIQFPELEGKQRILLFDSKGVLKKSVELVDKQTVISTEDLPPGFYVVQLSGENQGPAIRLIKR